jgi:Xaa-Pro aminopeptidase
MQLQNQTLPKETLMLKPQLAEFMRRMDHGSVAIIPAAREAVRSHDTHYRFRQNSDFFYLTGFEEPDAIAVIAPAKEQKYTLFVRPRDLEQEIWNGYRAGVEGAKADYRADDAFPVSEFDAKVLEILNGAKHLYYAFGNGNPELDEKIIGQLTLMRESNRKPYEPPRTIIDPSTIVHEMRVLKSAAEVEIMQRAADIAAEAHVEAMKSVRPGMKEFEVEAMIESIFRHHGSAAPAYNSIVGAGGNATVLHYINNTATLRDGDLLLVDAGAEYQGYASDITRTFPINGRFTESQRDIYDLVLETQMSCIDMVRPGVRLEDLKTHSVEMLTAGMVRLGLLNGDPKKLIEDKKYMQFYMHNLGHFLGIDVHDAGRYYFDGESRPAEPGMVMTIEPGVYISPDTTNIPEEFNQDVPGKYLGIGVRIEDDVLVTENGARVLTGKVPKDPAEIEALMAR